jgi:hypothetical protein
MQPGTDEAAFVATPTTQRHAGGSPVQLKLSVNFVDERNVDAVWNRISGLARITAVCTENLIRVGGVMNQLSWRNDRAALFRSGRRRLAIQVEVAA